MLDNTGTRQLAYVVTIDAIEPILGSDNCEAAIVGGWKVMTKKGTFKPGSLAIYFEIDSLCPGNVEAFKFLEPKHFRVKTQKYTFGGKNPGFYSQGLLMHPTDFGWTELEDCVCDGDGNLHFPEGETRFLTKQLMVTYYEPEDNFRKAALVDKYKKMANRHQKLFKKAPIRWLMRREWGKKLLFVFFGKVKDKKSGWPAWVKKTDEERVQNMPWILTDKRHWLVTEKLDGTSTTFTIHRHKYLKNKFDFYVCSRNVVFDKPDKKCFYDENVYLEMAQKYDVENVLATLMKSHPEWKWCTLQGETYGPGVQKRDYSLKEHAFAGFNFITSNEGRYNSNRAAAIFKDFGIPWVPIVDTIVLPDTVEELLAYATGPSTIDGGMREGFVFRDLDGNMSFKAVSNEFLDKYHRG